MPQEHHADYFRLGPQMCMYPCLAQVEAGAVAPFALRKSLEAPYVKALESFGPPNL